MLETVQGTVRRLSKSQTAPFNVILIIMIRFVKKKKKIKRRIT